MRYVFVYGTLRPGEMYHHLIGRYVRDVKPAFIRGKLYQLPEGYPALVLAKDLPGGMDSVDVRGELLGVDEQDKVLAILDELEDYYGPNDPRNLYERKSVTVLTRSGIPKECYIYVFVPGKLQWLEQNAMPIPRGDWVTWRRNR